MSEVFRKMENVKFADINSDETLLLSYSDYNIRIWNIETKKRINYKIPKIQNKISAITSSEYLKKFAIGTENGKVYVLENDGKIKWKYNTSNGKITNLIFFQKRVIIYFLMMRMVC